MGKLFNLARMGSTTTGTGSTIALTSTITGYISFANAGVSNGDVVDYAIKDGTSSEIGTATYSTTGPQLTGRTVTNSTNANAAINLSGAAEVAISPRAQSLMVGTAGATDNAALRADGTGTRDVQGSSLIIADTTGALSRSGGGGIPVQGKITGGAAIGDVGEIISATLAQASAISLSSSTEAFVLTMDLTAGEWDIFANPQILGDGSLAGVTDIITSLMVSAVPGGWSFNSPDLPTNRIISAGYATGATVIAPGVLVGKTRISVTTTFRLMIRISFSAGTAKGFGNMWARRI